MHSLLKITLSLSLLLCINLDLDLLAWAQTTENFKQQKQKCQLSQSSYYIQGLACNQVLNQNPKDLEALSARGYIWLWLNYPEQAQADWTAFSNLSPAVQNPKSQLIKAWLAMFNHDLKTAEAQITTALKSGQTEDLLLAKAWLLWQKGQVTEASQQLKYLLKQSKQADRIAYKWAVLLRTLITTDPSFSDRPKEEKAVEEALTSARKHNPSETDYLLMQTQVSGLKLSAKQILTQLELIVDTHPEIGDFQALKAIHLYEEMAEPEAALTSFKLVTEANSFAPQFWLISLVYQSQILIQQEQEHQVIVAIPQYLKTASFKQRCAEQTLFCGSLYSELGLSYLLSQNYTQALEALHTAQALQKYHSPMGSSYQGWAYFFLKQPLKARENWTKSAENYDLSNGLKPEHQVIFMRMLKLAEQTQLINAETSKASIAQLAQIKDKQDLKHFFERLLNGQLP
jgi:hypothetical protein